MTDKLEEIFRIQAALNDHIFKKQGINGSDGDILTMASIRAQVEAGKLGPNGDANRWLSNYLTALDDESRELRAELLWKWWSKDSLDIQNIRVEIVDLLHFLVSLAQCAGLTADDIYKVYLQKNEINFRRQADGYSKETKSDADNRSIKA